MIENRDPAFWRGIAAHPRVAHVLLGAQSELLDQIIPSERVLPLASENGGVIFANLDAFGRLWELHTLFTPDGWGKEALATCKAAFERLFGGGGQVVVTYEVEGNPQSRPPRTFRFQPVGDFGPTDFGQFRTWILTREAWESSPARKNMERH